MPVNPKKNDRPGATVQNVVAVCRFERQAQGLSVKRAAEKAGFHHRTWENAERGQNRPGIETIMRMLSVVGGCLLVEWPDGTVEELLVDQ
jgi:transcriptional regulator with XRE-family HTH domain